MNVQVSVITSCFQGANYIEKYFDNVLEQTIFPKIEIVFVHNKPDTQESLLVSIHKDRIGEKLQYIKVNSVETIGASWNRGWKAAKGEYLTIWNVDDKREPDSLEELVSVISQNDKCALAYGDFIEVPEYGSKSGLRRSTPKYSKGLFSRSFPTGGAFFMWKKEISKKIGYFDEQFKVGADFDFSVRVALNNLTMCKAKSLLGYYTNAGEGLSTRNESVLSAIERTVIQLRYAIFDKVRPKYLPAAHEYKIDKLKFIDKLYSVSNYIPDYEGFLKRRRGLWKIGKMRNSLRQLLKKLGLLQLVYRFQDRFIKREI